MEEGENEDRDKKKVEEEEAEINVSMKKANGLENKCTFLRLFARLNGF